MKLYEVLYNVPGDYEVICVTEDKERAMVELAESALKAGRWAGEYAVGVWDDGVYSDEFFGMRACDEGWECHHYYNDEDVAVWSVLRS